MKFSEYQERSRKTAIYPDAGHNFTYPALGLAGEAGEVSNKVKKILRDHAGTMTPEHVAEIQKELGDVLWYVAQLATEFGVDLDEIALQNVLKLESRLARNVLQGSGDNR